MRVFLVLLYLYASYVIAQPKNETFDSKLAKELKYKRGVLLRDIYMKEGCRVYDIYFDKEEGGYIEESLPSPSFITRRKDYYLMENQKKRESQVREHLKNYLP